MTTTLRGRFPPGPRSPQQPRADRLRRALAFGPCFVAEATHAMTELLGGVVNTACRPAFDVFNQACDVALQRSEIFASRCEIQTQSG